MYSHASAIDDSLHDFGKVNEEYQKEEGQVHSPGFLKSCSGSGVARPGISLEVFLGQALTTNCGPPEAVVRADPELCPPNKTGADRPNEESIKSRPNVICTEPIQS